jgi:pSer/pThr/pTyr-binding forkhead associated (FHA) protein
MTAPDKRHFLLRFLSGKYQGGEFPIPDEGEVVVGRSSELDMVLIEDMVSRKHAKISVGGGHVTIADLGSTNGTFVNGERVKRPLRLREGDRILIGNSILKLIVAQGAADHESAQQKLDQVAEAREREKTAAENMSGHVEDIPVLDILQLLTTGKKTGVLHVTGARSGKVVLNEGKLVSALLEGAHATTGTQAVERLLEANDGTFEFREKEAAPEGAAPVEGGDELLARASARQGDLRAALEKLPGPGASIALATPLPRLRELQPELLDLVELANNYGNVRSVLDRAPAGPLEAARGLGVLLERGYLRAL